MKRNNLTSALNPTRRHFLTTASVFVGAAGLAVATVPFIKYLQPSARARSAGAPVTVDIGKIETGQQITVGWRGKPVWILRRSATTLQYLDTESLRARLRDPDSLVTSQQPAYAKNAHRSIKDEYLVVIGICTHLGCVPSYRPELAPADLGPDWVGGYFCPCHGSRFDLAGRVFKEVPAPTNLVIPPYRFLSATQIRIGESATT